MRHGMRKVSSVELTDYCHMADKHDFMQLTEWENGEGWTVCIDARWDRRLFDLTYGESQALRALLAVAHKVEKPAKA
jgi:hypothetical protein